MNDLTVALTTNKIDLNVEYQGETLGVKVLTTENNISCGYAFNEPEIFYGEGRAKDGIVSQGDYFKVHTKDANDNPYTFKGWCIQSGSTDWFDQNYFTEDFN